MLRLAAGALCCRTAKLLLQLQLLLGLASASSDQPMSSDMESHLGALHWVGR
jgi:hypothetical protein